jgi:putative MFS transporter
LELAAGQATLQKMMVYPSILIVLFVILFLWVRSRKSKAVAA